MQQKFCSRGSGSGSFQSHGNNPTTTTTTTTAAAWQQPPGNGPTTKTTTTTSTSSASDKPFRCPRCGDGERFVSLASLRAHLEYTHSDLEYTHSNLEYYTHSHSHTHSEQLQYKQESYYQSHDGFSITGKLPDPVTNASLPSWQQDMSLPNRRGHYSNARTHTHTRSLSDTRESCDLHSYGSIPGRSSVRRRTQSVGVGTQADEDEEETDDEDEDEDSGDYGERDEENVQMSNRESENDLNHKHNLFSPHGPLEQQLELVDQNSFCGLETAAASVAVRRRLASILRAADNTMQRRLAKVSTELAQTDTELLCERAHSAHLAHERQQVADRQRSLSNQVDVAVMVIAALREQLNASENELERREREVLTIQRFLESAVRQETCGKVRIQHFIENLLRRIALAERLVEYYQDNGSPLEGNHYKHQQPTDNGPHRMTKSRSAGGHLSSGLHDSRPRSSSSSSHYSGRYNNPPPVSKPFNVPLSKPFNVPLSKSFNAERELFCVDRKRDFNLDRKREINVDRSDVKMDRSECVLDGERERERERETARV